jgi:hypothetical protein
MDDEGFIRKEAAHLGCPFLWRGEIIEGCYAYPEDLKLPEYFSQMDYCYGSRHVSCPYYIRAKKSEETLKK